MDKANKNRIISYSTLLGICIICVCVGVFCYFNGYGTEGAVRKELSPIIDSFNELNNIKNNTAKVKASFKESTIVIEYDDGAIKKEFVVNYKGLNSDDSYKVIRFLASNYSKENIGPNLLLNTEIEVDCKLDTEGNPIRGTGFVVPREIRAVLYLKENNLPLTDINFTALVKRFVRENKKIKVNK